MSWGTNPPGSREPETIGRYRVTRRLGQGGMGVVYAAHDDRLDRDVAIKRIRDAAGDAALRERLLREARAAARINHPNICHVYELAEEGGELYLVMELLEGEALEQRLARERIPVGEALRIALGMLSALEALHARGIIHRDLKPSNVFLTPHGVKLLDFGLARPVAEQFRSEVTLTQPGTLMGTPRYMSPEQWEGEVLSHASDLFAVGAILFEMLAGKPAFPGSTIIEVFRAVAIAEPPALTGGPEVMAADRVIQLAIAKRAADRYPDAATMAREIREALSLVDTGSSPQARAMTRLIVLPFRVLRPDPDIDFLAFSVPDAISSSLSGLESLVVRSTAAGQRFAAGATDLKTIAAEAGVDVVVTGTLLRAGDQVRVSTQMLEAPCGHAALLRHGAGARSPTSSSSRTTSPGRSWTRSRSRSRPAIAARSASKQPVSAKAYDLYLRANHVGASTSNPARLTVARDLYRSASRRTPTTRRRGRDWAGSTGCWRSTARRGSAGSTRARGGGVPPRARDRPRPPAGAQLLHLLRDRGDGPGARGDGAPAGAGRGAARPIRISSPGSWSPAASADCSRPRWPPTAGAAPRSGDPDERAIHLLGDGRLQPGGAARRGRHPGASGHGALWMLGREDEAIAGVREALHHAPGSLEHWIVESQLAAMEGRLDDCLRHEGAILDAGFHDPEGLLLHGRELAFVGPAGALELVHRVVHGGYHCPTALTRDPWLDSLRGDPAFVRVVRQAEAGRARAAEAYPGRAANASSG